MARNGKDINIPMGPKSQSEDIREALMAKMKQQEELSHASHAAQPAQTPQQQTPQQPQAPVQRQQQYANYGAYSSPFRDTKAPSQPFTNSPNNLVDAIHANEPIQYKPKKRKSAAKTLLVLFLMIAIIFSLSWALREFVFQAYEIPSGSMEKTIMT